MRVQFKTENGTIYTLDKDLMTWERTSSTPRSGKTRSEHGRLLDWPDIEVGRSALLFDTDVLKGCVAHAVWTSLVTEVNQLAEVPSEAS